ncbi:GatB/YqeY domain-containing protein [Sphingobacterium sp. SRCM116780]|uniref:GatB/YqeY domain-containing protein n=1 Tax=Sphingobacterium sp. SRCM116780 TaxID=2907623 RepID=UPI001F25F863|nr:GatB/YqeY domain-containing protein [Sphingobacterium sp. SRCM116780]UIR57216.1 GatB/YqeY domain-containing protein [Sphingobacterium sp. SRCM116780]
MALEEKINQDIKAAMIAKDANKLRGLRAIKAAILLAKTEKGHTEDLNEETEIKVLQKLVKQRKESAEIYKNQNREDLYTIEVEEQQVIEAYLPQQLSKEEVEKIIKDIISSTGATSVKDMGKVMGAANQQLAGKADGRTISEVVKGLLA